MHITVSFPSVFCMAPLIHHRSLHRTLDPQGDTLAELWLNFLLLESEQELGPDGKPLHPTVPEKTVLGSTPSATPRGPSGSTGKELIPVSPPKAAVRSYSFTTGYASKESNSNNQSRVESTDKSDTVTDSSSSSGGVGAIEVPQGDKS